MRTDHRHAGLVQLANGSLTIERPDSRRLVSPGVGQESKATGISLYPGYDRNICHGCHL